MGRRAGPLGLSSPGSGRVEGGCLYAEEVVISCFRQCFLTWERDLGSCIEHIKLYLQQIFCNSYTSVCLMYILVLNKCWRVKATPWRSSHIQACSKANRWVWINENQYTWKGLFHSIDSSSVGNSTAECEMVLTWPWHKSHLQEIL